MLFRSPRINFRTLGPPRSSRLSSMNRRSAQRNPSFAKRAVELLEAVLKQCRTAFRTCAKYADAFLSISLVCRNSRTSRSNSLIRAFAALIGPAARHHHAGPDGPKRAGCPASSPIDPQSPSAPQLRSDIHRGVPSPAAPHARGTQVNTASSSSSVYVP